MDYATLAYRPIGPINTFQASYLRNCYCQFVRQIKVQIAPFHYVQVILSYIITCLVYLVGTHVAPIPCIDIS